MKPLPSPVWLIPAVLLVVATGHLPYGYYQFMRLVVTAACVLVAVERWTSGRGQWIAIVFGLAGLLFNPFVPVRLSRGDWFLPDLASAAMFAAYAAWSWRQGRKPVAQG